MQDMQQITRDLAGEHEALDAIVAGIDEAAWKTPSPAEGWDVKDQITHLAYYDEAAAEALSDPDKFYARVSEAAKDIAGFTETWLAIGRSKTGAEVLRWWRTARQGMLEALAPLDPKARVPWMGPPMSALSFTTARLMETWSHGQDVVDALGLQRKATDRLRHVAHLGALTRGYSFRANGLPVPEEPVRVELTAPSGEIWNWGEAGARDLVTGPAEDFCLVVTQRRHPDDTDLVATGPVAEKWLSIAQAFAGPPGAGRLPGQFPRRRDSQESPGP